MAMRPPSPIQVSSTDDQSDDPTVLHDYLRDRQVFRYLEPWRSAGAASRVFHTIQVTVAEQSTPSLVEVDPNAPPKSARGCDDTALAAFAQLGALRLHAQRALITLFGREHEYLLAESTRTLSLQSDTTHDNHDALWIGTANFPRRNGFADHVFPDWDQTVFPREPNPLPDHYYTDGKTSHWLVVSDLRQHRGALQQLLPLYNKNIRFIAAVPLIGHLGCIVGAYIILDDIPRYGISEQELVFMEDMASTAVNHLTSKRGLWQKRLAERLIQGLGVFSRGGSSLREWWLERLDSEQNQSRRQEKDQIVHDLPREKQADHEMGATFHAPRSKTKHHLSPSSSAAVRRPIDDPSVRDSTPYSQGLVFDLKKATQQVFARGSNVIREAMDMDGVVFLDAGFAQLDTSRSRRRSGTSTSTSIDEPSDQAPTPTSGSRVGPSDRKVIPLIARPDAMCTPLAYSTKVDSSLRGFGTPQKYESLPQTKVVELLKRYPEGKIFNFSLEGLIQPGSGSDFADPTKALSSVGKPSKRKRTYRKSSPLRKMCDDAGSVAFIPLWDPHRESWRAVALIWTTTSGRSMTREDLLYLTSFGSCVSGEIIKLDTLAADHAKATFMSCISHELRSPLHGVLAGAEFLLDSHNLNHAQREMATTVQLAGTSLLDTINSILDFSKINTLSSRKAGVEGTAGADGDLVGDSELLDLALLTENIINAITAEQRYQASVKESALINPSSAGIALNRDKVQIVLQITPQRSWMISIAPAQWARLMSIVVGNALKFTTAGFVRIVLDQIDDRAVLSITDTGCEISAAFQEHHLFVPFKQEKSHTPGTGLGLYIAKQIVDSLNGKIKVSSSSARGHGTEVVVDVPAGLQEDMVHMNQNGIYEVPVVCRSDRSPMRIAMVTAQHDQSDQATDVDPDSHMRNLMVLSTVSNVCKDWLGITPIQLATLDEARTEVDVWVMLESDFFLWLGRQADPSSMRDGAPRILALTEQLGPSAAWLCCESEAGLDCFLDAPFGPRRLGYALLRKYEGPEGTGNFNGKWKERVERGSVGSSTAGSPASPSMKFTRSPALRRGPYPITPSASYRDAISKKKILLVEDNDLNMRILVAWATKLKLPVEQAVNGLQAVEIYKANPTSIGLILTDISMPVMDGFTATREIRKFEVAQGLSRCKIAALTGVASRDARDEAAAVGIDVFFSKPATYQQVRRLVQEMEH